MKIGKKLQWITALVVILALAVPWAVFADDIANNLDASVDAVAEEMPLNVGGSNGTTTLYLVERNGDGKEGCNLTGQTTLVVSVSSSNMSVATVSPTSVTFTSCGFTQVLTVTPVGEGNATVSLSQTSNGTKGSFDLTTATFTVKVAPPANTAPSISISGVTGGASYEIGAVPAATCEVTDAEDGGSSFLADLGAVIGPLAAYGLGAQTASCSYTDSGGLTASASVTYSIVDTTAPVITYVSRTPANDNGWNNGDVTVEWSCTDAGSGVALASVFAYVTGEGKDQSATGTCTDNAGNTASDEQTGINIDLTPPTISGAADRDPNANDWYNADVTVTFTCDDELSGVDSCTKPVTLGEGADQSVPGEVTDLAGNSASATVTGINIDKTAPTISGAPDRAANANGWYKADVTVTFTCGDALSGVASCTAPVTLGEGANQSADGTVIDLAGNAASTSVTGINIDKTTPTVALVGGPADGGTYYFGFVPAAPTCSASDTLSGLDGACSVSGYGTAVGDHTVTASATDKAGNSASASASYTVAAWTLKGFYQPVDMTPEGAPTVWNTVKGGSTVPLKWEVFAGATELTSTSYIITPLVKQVTCNAGTEDTVEVLATGGTTLRYDTVAGQFVYNWQTPKLPGKCYQVTMTTQDGSFLTASFKLK